MIKPNKDEIMAITIMISMVIGFGLGILSVSGESKKKDQDIEDLLEIVETQEKIIDKFLK